jgi:hypothetical protein
MSYSRNPLLTLTGTVRVKIRCIVKRDLGGYCPGSGRLFETMADAHGVFTRVSNH